MNTDTVISATTTHQFTIDPNIINHLITHQAGTRIKALLELIMNSLDAKATKISITESQDGFILEDNGEGFASEEDVIRYFGRFGTPHQAGDATYGRFRMGRAQIMAFGRVTWRSNTFEMEVDIKKNGLGYNLKSDCEVFEGCRVTCEFFDKYGQWFLKRSVADSIRFVPCEITINGEPLVTIAEEDFWTHETDVFKFRQSETNELSVYNQGVFVTTYPSKHAGVGGVLVSKEPLEVNFARNDVLHYSCKVWYEADKYFKTIALKRSSTKIPREMRPYYLSQFIGGGIGIRDFMEMKLFESANGKIVSITGLFSKNIVTVADTKGGSYAEHLCSFNDLFVLQAGELENFGYGDLDDLFSDVEDGFMTVSDNTHYVHGCIGYSIEEIEDEVGSVEVFNRDIEDNRMASSFLSWYYNVDVYDDLYDLADEYKQELQLLKPEQLRGHEQVILDVFNKYSNDLAKHCEFVGRRKHFVHNDAIRPNGDRRKIHIGNSLGSAEAWTDGRTFIALDREVVDVCIKRRSDGIMYLLLLILHEYTHMTGSVSENVHGADFYEFFHEAVISPTLRGKKYGGLYLLAKKCSRGFVSGMNTAGLKTSEFFVREVGYVSDRHIDSVIESMRLLDVPVTKKERNNYFYHKVDKKDYRYDRLKYSLRMILSNPMERKCELEIEFAEGGKIVRMEVSLYDMWYVTFKIPKERMPDYNDPVALDRFVLEVKADVAYLGVLNVFACEMYIPQRADLTDEVIEEKNIRAEKQEAVLKIFRDAFRRYF